MKKSLIVLAIALLPYTAVMAKGDETSSAQPLSSSLYPNLNASSLNNNNFYIPPSSANNNMKFSLSFYPTIGEDISNWPAYNLHNNKFKLTTLFLSGALFLSSENPLKTFAAMVAFDYAFTRTRAAMEYNFVKKYASYGTFSIPVMPLYPCDKASEQNPLWKNYSVSSWMYVMFGGMLCAYWWNSKNLENILSLYAIYGASTYFFGN